jgi:hypothetical protein
LKRIEAVVNGYQVKNVQILTDTIYHVWPRPGGKTSTLRIMKFPILVEAFLLYITKHLVFLTYMYFQRRFFLKLVNFDTFSPSPNAIKTEIHNLCLPCPKDASYQI